MNNNFYVVNTLANEAYFTIVARGLANQIGCCKTAAGGSSTNHDERDILLDSVLTNQDWFCDCVNVEQSFKSNNDMGNMGIVNNNDCMDMKRECMKHGLRSCEYQRLDRNEYGNINQNFKPGMITCHNNCNKLHNACISRVTCPNLSCTRHINRPVNG